MDDPKPFLPAGLFDSVETGAPFRRCIHCHCDLIGSGRPYLVNKEFAHDDCVLEYALCDECRQQLSGELSHSSRSRVQQILESEVDWARRCELTATATDLGAWIDHCLLCGHQRDSTIGFGLSAVFSGGALLPGPLPAILCAACSERIQSCLSRQTRDFWDRFCHDHFPGPPADVVDLPSPRIPVMF